MRGRCADRAIWWWDVFSAYAQRENNVPAGIQMSRDLGLADAAAEINITVHFTLNDKAAFDKAVDALYDRSSPTYHKWMSDGDLKKFAPSASQRQIVRQELEKHGMTILSTDRYGFTIRAHGTIANVEKAFNTEIHQFEYNGKVYRANVRNARLTGEAGDYVYTVAGIESHQVQPLYKQAIQSCYQEAQCSPVTEECQQTGRLPLWQHHAVASRRRQPIISAAVRLPRSTLAPGTRSTVGLICDYIPSQLQAALGLNDVYAAGYTGTGQTIVLVEGYGYPTLEKDANGFLQAGGIATAYKSNFQIVYPEGKPNPTSEL